MEFRRISAELSNEQKLAQQCISTIKSRSFNSVETLHEHLYQFVLHKYLLYGEVQDVYVLDELAKLSVAKSLRVSRELAIEYDNGATCEGATSAMKKKILLLIALQRELDVQFDPDKIAYLTTTHDITQALWDKLNAKK